MMPVQSVEAKCTTNSPQEEGQRAGAEVAFTVSGLLLGLGALTSTVITGPVYLFGVTVGTAVGYQTGGWAGNAAPTCEEAGNRGKDQGMTAGMMAAGGVGGAAATSRALSMIQSGGSLAYN